jgi:hypothetical protein
MSNKKKKKADMSPESLDNISGSRHLNFTLVWVFLQVARKDFRWLLNNNRGWSLPWWFYHRQDIGLHFCNIKILIYQCVLFLNRKNSPNQAHRNWNRKPNINILLYSNTNTRLYISMVLTIWQGTWNNCLVAQAQNRRFQYRTERCQVLMSWCIHLQNRDVW